MENAVYGYVTPRYAGPAGEEVYLDQLKILVAGNPSTRSSPDRRGEGRGLVESRGHPVSRRGGPGPGQAPARRDHGAPPPGHVQLRPLRAPPERNPRGQPPHRAPGVAGSTDRGDEGDGGARRQVAPIYLVQALPSGAAALLVSLPIGVRGRRTLCRYMAGFLNFDVTSFGVPAWVYLLEVAVGLVVPVLAAARPVWKASALSVREALSEVGAFQSAFGTTAFDRALAGVGGLSRPRRRKALRRASSSGRERPPTPARSKAVAPNTRLRHPHVRGPPNRQRTRLPRPRRQHGHQEAHQDLEQVSPGLRSRELSEVSGSRPCTRTARQEAMGSDTTESRTPGQGLAQVIHQAT